MHSRIKYYENTTEVNINTRQTMPLIKYYKQRQRLIENNDTFCRINIVEKQNVRNKLSYCYLKKHYSLQ